jgi:hypothetical protein
MRVVLQEYEFDTGIFHGCKSQMTHCNHHRIFLIVKRI